MLIFKCLSNGRLTENIAPLPSALFSAHILPPWASIVPLEIKNPDPDPVSELVTNFENNLSYSSESIPVPLSFMLIITLASLLPLILFLLASSDSTLAKTVIVLLLPSLLLSPPVFCVNLIAFVSRFDITSHVINIPKGILR
jgi:hypothetical protein